MNVSTRLPDEDIAFLDDYAKSHGHASRAAVVRKAVRLLRLSELGPAYEAGWAETAASGDDVLWDQTSADGL